MNYNKFELDYKTLLTEVEFWGEKDKNRTGVDALCAFGKNLIIDTTLGVPILTSRKIFFDKAYHEYRWIRDGLTTTKYLNDNGIKWWNQYANEKGELGKTYGYQLRNFNDEIDQLEHVHKELRMNSRRAHVTLWNPSELNETPLPPCYTGFTFMRQGDKLNLSVQMRSSDLMLGLPYDILVMYFFLLDIAKFNELKPANLCFQITNAHIYENHLKQLNEYTVRKMHLPPALITKEDGSYSLKDYKHEEHIILPLNL